MALDNCWWRECSYNPSILVCQPSGLDSFKGFAYQDCPTFWYCDMMPSSIKFTCENCTIELPKKIAKWSMFKWDYSSGLHCIHRYPLSRVETHPCFRGHGLLHGLPNHCLSVLKPNSSYPVHLPLPPISMVSFLWYPIFKHPSFCFQHSDPPACGLFLPSHFPMLPPHPHLSLSSVISSFLNSFPLLGKSTTIVKFISHLQLSLTGEKDAAMPNGLHKMM